jgi:hypothetical protein
MNKRHTSALAAAFLCGLLAASIALAQSTVDWWVIAGRGFDLEHAYPPQSNHFLPVGEGFR